MQKLIKRQVSVIKKISILFIFLFYTGCTTLKFNQEREQAFKEKELFSCEKKAKAKSLQFLEQKYRCSRALEREVE